MCYLFWSNLKDLSLLLSLINFGFMAFWGQIALAFTFPLSLCGMTKILELSGEFLAEGCKPHISCELHVKDWFYSPVNSGCQPAPSNDILRKKHHDCGVKVSTCRVLPQPESSCPAS